MKPARELLKSGRVSEAKYEAPLLSGYVREGAKNYRSGLRIKSAIDVENLCSCWESRSAGKICAHSVAVGLGYLNPPAAAVAVPNEPTKSEAPAGPQFVAAESADAAPNDTARDPAAQFRGRMAERADHDRRRSGSFSKPPLVSALPKKNTFAVDNADLVLIESLRAVPAIFESGMCDLATRRIPAAASRRCRIIRVLLLAKRLGRRSLRPRCVPSFWSSHAARGASR